MMLYPIKDTQTLGGVCFFKIIHNKLYSVAEMQPFLEGNEQLFDKHCYMRLGFCTVHPVSTGLSNLAGHVSAELTGTRLVIFLPCRKNFVYRAVFSFSVLNNLCLCTGISWSIKETASSSTSSLEGRDSSLQKGSSSNAALPKQVSSYSLSSLFKGEVPRTQCGQMAFPSTISRGKSSYLM